MVSLSKQAECLDDAVCFGLVWRSGLWRGTAVSWMHCLTNWSKNKRTETPCRFSGGNKTIQLYNSRIQMRCRQIMMCPIKCRWSCSNIWLQPQCVEMPCSSKCSLIATHCFCQQVPRGLNHSGGSVLKLFYVSIMDCEWILISRAHRRDSNKCYLLGINQIMKWYKGRG